MSERLLDKRWPWMALCLILFALVMGFLHYLMHGISKDFGAGFALGLVVSAVIVLTAVGWRRGELGSSEPSSPDGRRLKQDR